MTLTLAIPTLRRFDLLAECVASARAGTRPPDMVTIIDNSGGRCPPVPGAGVALGRQPQSVAAAWNDAAQAAHGDWLLIANDDVRFAPDTVARLLALAEACPQAGIVSALPQAPWCLFLLNLRAYDDVGTFDEGFRPAYFEDDDYGWRLRLAGYELAVAESAVRHAGSATVRQYDAAALEAHKAAYRANRDRYRAKWGGEPGRERYRLAWNGATHADV